MTSGFVFAFRDVETFNTIGTGVGDNFSFGVASVAPDRNAGTTGTATNADGVTLELQTPLASGRPGIFAREFDYGTARDNGYLQSWDIELRNGPDTLSRVTPDRTSAAAMSTVESLAISGSATAPTLTWRLPTTGPSVSRVQYSLWNDDDDEVIMGDPAISLDSGAVELGLTGLTSGVGYAARIIVSHDDEEGRVETRSSNWISWRAESAAPLDFVVELTTGSPASLSQIVDVPADPFNLAFDYRFATTTGDLTVFLDGEPIGTPLSASSPAATGFKRAFFEIDDRFLGRGGLDLSFVLDGPTGSVAQLDNIVFPGLEGGDFASLASWTSGGVGSVRLVSAPAPVPAPAALLLAASAFAALGLFRAARRAA